MFVKAITQTFNEHAELIAFCDLSQVRMNWHNKQLEQIFHSNPPEDKFKCAASHVDGAASILLGIAANHSLKTKLVQVDDLFDL